MIMEQRDRFEETGDSFHVWIAISLCEDISLQYLPWITDYLHDTAN